jgi:integrase
MAPSLTGRTGSLQDPRRQSQAPNLRNVLVERHHLSEREIDLLMEAARQHRWGHRDATAILVAYQHGLRACELVALRWVDIDLTTGRLRIRRSKGGGVASSHPISAQESLALRRLRDEAASSAHVLARHLFARHVFARHLFARHVFASEHGAPFRVTGFERMIARAGAEAGFGFVVRSRMLWRELALETSAEPGIRQ